MSQIAQFCSWTYAIAWGVAFYPSLVLNFRLKTSDSISIDTSLLNLLGYLCFTLSIYLQGYDSTVRSQFKARFDGNLPTLSSADLLYSLHGFTLILVLLSQIVFGNRAWGFHNKRTTFRLSRLTKFFYAAFLVFLIYNIFIPAYDFKALDFALSLSYFKISISFTKYLPQVAHNKIRKSMHGISKLQIFLDLVGCTFAILELLLKNSELPFNEIITANITKVGVIFVTLLFDCIFIVQFQVYPDIDNEIKHEKYSSETLV